MSYFNTQNNNQFSVETINLQQYQQEANALVNHNVKKLERFNNIYWYAQMNHSQIMNDAEASYNLLKQKEQSIIQDLNPPHVHIRLYRDKEKHYFKPTLFSGFVAGTREDIANEISSIYGNVNIVFVDDLNEALPHNNSEIRINTTYIADTSIPYIQDDVFNPTMISEIYKNYQGVPVRNHYTTTAYLFHRHLDYFPNEEIESYPKHVISKITNTKDDVSTLFHTYP